MKPKPSHAEVLRRITSGNVLVVGDLILDLYVRGEVTRISPEAPVPVILESSREYALGGAGNVAANVASLGGRTTLLGVVDGDGEGNIVRDLCRAAQIKTAFVREPKRPTTMKMRALAGHHQLVRVDRESSGEILAATKRQAVHLVQGLPDQDIVVLSDYAKGFLCAEVVGALRSRFGARRIMANIKPASRTELYKHIGVITVNAREAGDLTGISVRGGAQAGAAARKLSSRFDASVIVTRGDEGMTVFEREPKKLAHIHAVPLHVFDVTGAGDTVIATTAVLLAAGMPLISAARVANRAAGIVVGKPGTATVHAADLEEELAHFS